MRNDAIYLFARKEIAKEIDLDFFTQSTLSSFFHRVALRNCLNSCCIPRALPLPTNCGSQLTTSIYLKFHISVASAILVDFQTCLTTRSISRTRLLPFRRTLILARTLTPLWVLGILRQIPITGKCVAMWMWMWMRVCVHLCIFLCEWRICAAIVDLTSRIPPPLPPPPPSP